MEKPSSFNLAANQLMKVALFFNRLPTLRSSIRFADALKDFLTGQWDRPRRMSLMRLEEPHCLEPFGGGNGGGPQNEASNLRKKPPTVPEDV